MLPLRPLATRAETHVPGQSVGANRTADLRGTGVRHVGTPHEEKEISHKKLISSFIKTNC